MQSKLPDILRKVRLDRKKTQDDAAEIVGVDKSTYGRYENGTVAIGFEQVVQLASYYKLTLDELYNYGDPSFKVEDPKLSYQKRWAIPITVTLDGTAETLQFWLSKLTSINGSI